MREASELAVAPRPEVAERRARAALRVEIDGRYAEAHQARKHGLLEVAVARKRHVLDHRRQLVVVADRDEALQTRRAGFGVVLLQHQRDERLDLEDLRRLFHDDIVILEAKLNQLRSTYDEYTAAKWVKNAPRHA